MCDADEILELLRKLPQQLSNPDKNAEDKYNIFDVLGVEYNEVIICRFIGDLLDSKGSHRLGTEPLRQFIHDVLKDTDNIPESNLETAIVSLEGKTDNDRRIDIVIHLQDKIYPIEVKIWAGDQDKQLEDYYQFCFGKSDPGKIYYLTPNGREPSTASRGNLVVGDQIHCISFSKHIKDWLNGILDGIQEKTDKPIKYVIKNFVEVIDKMNKQSDDLKKITEALGLEKANEMCYDYDTELIENVIFLLKYSDKIWAKIRQNYLHKIISCGEYVPVDCNGKEKDDVDSHTLMYVKNGNDAIVARICVETNLYIITKKNADECSSSWTEYNNDYQWKYLYKPDTEKQIKLNVPTELDYDIKIDLTKILHSAEQ